MESNDFYWEVKVLLFSVMDFSVAACLIVDQYYDCTQGFWTLIQMCWQLDRWANMRMDFPGNPLDSERHKAHLKSFLSAQQELS